MADMPRSEEVPYCTEPSIRTVLAPTITPTRDGPGPRAPIPRDHHRHLIALAHLGGSQKDPSAAAADLETDQKRADFSGVPARLMSRPSIGHYESSCNSRWPRSQQSNAIQMLTDSQWKIMFLVAVL
jgi:hypothetical protein